MKEESKFSKNHHQAKGLLYVVSAPSGAGKTSLIDALLKREPGVSVAVSHTTRPPRQGERQGDHYHFVDASAFEKMVKADAFLEHAHVFGQHYGTSRQAVDCLLEKGRDVILEIDWQGADQISALMPESISIFILPPSLESLKKRLFDRNQDDEKVIDHRLKQASADIAHCRDFDYLVVNDDFERAVFELQSIIVARRCVFDVQAERLAGLLRDLVI